MHGSNDVGGWRRWRKARVVRWKRCHLEATHDRPTRVTYFRVSRRQLPNAGVAPVTARLPGPPLSLSPPTRRPRPVPSSPAICRQRSAAAGTGTGREPSPSRRPVRPRADVIGNLRRRTPASPRARARCPAPIPPPTTQFSSSSSTSYCYDIDAY